METRTLTQVKIYLLFLNPITANSERNNLVAISYDKDILIKWYEGQKEEWRDGQYLKSFKKGSFLENYNAVEGTYGNGHFSKSWTTESDINDLITEAKESFGLIKAPILLGKEES